MNEHVQVSDSTFTVDEKNDCHDIQIFFVWTKKFRMKWILNEQSLIDSYSANIRST